MFLKDQNKDERAISVENSSYTLAFKLISFALLIDVIYRAVVFKQASWDLLAIVIFAGLAATLYQTRFRITSRSWVKAILLSLLAALVVAAVLVLALR